jgi:3'-phosphoadenosine 5'-phosphosulfate synthase
VDGWTKADDVPLDVRVKQHEEVLNAGLTHPGGLDPATTVTAIWPAPMVYAGPTEVQFDAKSRRCAGASYFVVGRDPAGMKGSLNALAHADDDLYDGEHGRNVLQYSPGIGDMKMLSFVKVMYDITDNVMKIPDESQPNDFSSISGSKMPTVKPTSLSCQHGHGNSQVYDYQDGSQQGSAQQCDSTGYQQGWISSLLHLRYSLFSITV